jgi:superfamily II DNA or RNA helicase
VESLDLSGIKIVGGDFQQQALQAELNKEANIQRLCLITAEEQEGQTVLFTASVSSSKAAAHYLNNNYGIPAVYVYGTQPEEERREALRAFKSGEAKVLCNCQVVAVGFDYPPTATLILGRPTRSRSFWLQCVGRATRPLPGVVDFEGSTPDSRRAAVSASAKKHFKIVDCTTGSIDHSLVTSVDMFCPAADEEVKKAVKKAAAESKKPLTAEEMADIAAKEAERIASAKAIEAMRKNTQGRGFGRVASQEIDITWKGKRPVGTYTNPLRGKYGGLKMSQLPDHYIRWACDAPSIGGWVKGLFCREWERRHGIPQAS